MLCEDALGPDPGTFPGLWLSREPCILATGIILTEVPWATASSPASSAATSWSLSLPDLFPAQRPETPPFPCLSITSHPSSPHTDCITSHPDPWLFHPASPVPPPQSQLSQRPLPHALPHSPLCQNPVLGLRQSLTRLVGQWSPSTFRGCLWAPYPPGFPAFLVLYGLLYGLSLPSSPLCKGFLLGLCLPNPYSHRLGSRPLQHSSLGCSPAPIARD